MNHAFTRIIINNFSGMDRVYQSLKHQMGTGEGSSIKTTKHKQYTWPLCSLIMLSPHLYEFYAIIIPQNTL